MPRPNNVALFLLPGVVLLASPPAGGWAHALAEAGAFAGLLFLLLRSGNRLLSCEKPPGLLPLGVLALFLLVQVVPLPPFLLEIVSPLTAQWYGRSVWLTDPGVSMPLSVRPKSTLLAFFTLAAGWALYLLSSTAVADRERLKGMTHLLCVLAVVAALPTLAVLLVPAWGHLRPYLPFWLLAPLLPLSTGLYLGTRPESTFGTWGERMTDLCLRPFSSPHHVAALAALLSGGVLILAPLPWRLGGVGGMTALALLFLLRQGKRSWAVPLFAAALFLFFGGLAFGGPGQGIPRLFGAGVPFPAVFGAGAGAGEMIPRAGEEMVGGVGALVRGGGGAGALLAGCFILTFFARNVIAWRRRKRRLPIALGASALAASLVPILAAALGPGGEGKGAFLLFFLLAGMAAAGSRSSNGTQSAEAVSSLRRYGAVGAVLLVLAGYVAFKGGILSASVLSSGGSSDPRTAAFDPLDEGYRIDLGRAALKGGEGEKALGHFRAALRLSPLTGESLQGVALARRALGEKESAAGLLEASLGLGSGVRDGYRLYVDSLFAARRMEEGKSALRKAVGKHPAETAFYLDLLARYGIPPEEAQGILPGTFAVLAAYGDYLRQHGQTGRAAEAYRAALERYDDTAPDPAGVVRIAEWFARTGDPDEALTAVRVGLRRSPRNPELRRVAADCYERSGVTVRAEEERRALKLLEGGRGEKAR